MRKILLACTSSSFLKFTSFSSLLLSDGDIQRRQQVQFEARQSYFSVYLSLLALELCDFYSSPVVPKLD